MRDSKISDKAVNLGNKFFTLMKEPEIFTTFHYV